MASCLKITGDIWIFDPREASTFMKRRIAMLVESGYLKPDGPTSSDREYYRAVGNKKAYSIAIDKLLDGKS